MSHRLFYQVCDNMARTGAVEPELKFQAPAPGIYIFWLRLQNDLVHWKLKPLYYLYNSLHPIGVYREGQRAMPPKNFWKI